ncbi:hypothetical protein ACHQM5_013437 [Ranunculus cassubicifolius]
METMGATHEPTTQDEDLKHLRTQLYSAAEYFEVSYTTDAQKEQVVNTLKEYTVKALVNTVDHLGSITYKVTDMMDEKVDEVSGTELRVSCIQQRLRTCQDCIDHEGLSQQSFVMATPKYHKRYTLPGRQNKHTASEDNATGVDNDDNWEQLKNALRTTMTPLRSSTIKVDAPRKKKHTPSPSSRSLQLKNFSFTDRIKDSDAPHRSKFPLLRTVSMAVRATTPNPSRPNTLSRSNTRPRAPSEPKKSSSMRIRSAQEKPNELERHPSKSKRLLKSFLSRKTKKDDTLFTYLDEF